MTTNFIPTALAPLHAKLEAIGRVIDSTKQLKHKGEAYASNQKGKKKHFTPNGNNLPKKNNETDKKREFSKKFFQRYEEHGGAQTTHNIKTCRKYDDKGKLLESFGQNKQNGGNRNYKKPREKFDSHSFVHIPGKEIEKTLKQQKSQERAS